MSVRETRLTMSNVHRIDRHRINHAPLARHETARTLPPPAPLWLGHGGIQANAVFCPRLYLAFNGASALIRMPMTIMLNQAPRCPKGTRWMTKKQRQGCQKRNGIWHGRHTVWHRNGKKRAEGKYVNGQKHSLWKEWHSNGKLRASGIFSNGNQHGLFKFWHPNGKMHALGKFANGNAHGLWKLWHANGKKSAVGKYVNGKKHGLWQKWHANGKKKAEDLYINGSIVKDSWISKELKRLYRTKRWKAGKGVDLNGNGRIERNEKIATHNSNTIPGNDKSIVGDWTDWLAFYRANYKAINSKSVRNKNSIFFWSAKFKSKNPIHIITSVESPLVKRQQVLKAYRKTWKIIARARKIPVKGSSKLKLAKAKLLAVYTAILKSGIKLKDQYNKHLFIDNMADGILDCDTSSFVILTEAHEKRWPVFGVLAPKHFFVRWDDKSSRVRFNMDLTSNIRFPNDKAYKNTANISSRAISAGVYLKNLGLSALVATVIVSRGLSYRVLGKTQRAIKDFTQAIKLNPRFAVAYFNRGVKYEKLGSYKHALIDYTKAIKLDPNHASAYNNRGATYSKMRKYKRGILDFTKAIRLNPAYAVAYYNRASIFLFTKQYTLAVGDYKKLLSLIQKSNPTYIQVRDNLEKAYLNRGIKRVKKRKFADAVSDFREVLKLNPKNSLVSFLIKKYTPCIRNPRRCP